jgi:hypothetical protein
MVGYLNPVADIIAGGNLASWAVFRDRKIGIEVVWVPHYKLCGNKCRAARVNRLHGPGTHLCKGITSRLDRI